MSQSASRLKTYRVDRAVHFGDDVGGDQGAGWKVYYGCTGVYVVIREHEVPEPPKPGDVLAFDDDDIGSLRSINDHPLGPVSNPAT